MNKLIVFSSDRTSNALTATSTTTTTA